MKPARLDDLAQAVEAIQAYWRGERGDFKDSSIPPTGMRRDACPILISADGPKAAALSGRVGDGLLYGGTHGPGGPAAPARGDGRRRAPGVDRADRLAGGGPRRRPRRSRRDGRRDGEPGHARRPRRARRAARDPGGRARDAPGLRLRLPRRQLAPAEHVAGQRAADELPHRHAVRLGRRGTLAGRARRSRGGRLDRRHVHPRAGGAAQRDRGGRAPSASGSGGSRPRWPPVSRSAAGPASAGRRS